MDNPQLVPSAIKEMLRFESPVQRALFRLAAETFTIGTTAIERGRQVSAIIGAANRDPDQFAQPDTFDITLTGDPAVILPATQSAQGLTVGVQIVGSRWQDRHLLM